MFVIVAHEFGHYITSLNYTEAAMPIFIPAICFVFGLTMVMPTGDSEEMVRIYKAGPKWGMIASALVALVGALLNSAALILSGITLVCCELYSMTLGSDGRRIKSARLALT
jgi:hypothetical protein